MKCKWEVLETLCVEMHGQERAAHFTVISSSRFGQTNGVADSLF